MLISPYANPVNFGLWMPFACLRCAGPHQRAIFLPRANEMSSFLLFDPLDRYERSFV